MCRGRNYSRHREDFPDFSLGLGEHWISTPHRKQHQGGGGGSGEERPPRAGHIFLVCSSVWPDLVLNQSDFQVEPK